MKIFWITVLHCTLELYKIFLCPIKNEVFNDTIVFISTKIDKYIDVQVSNIFIKY